MNTVDSLTAAEHVEVVKGHASALAESLRVATDAGVSHAILLPQLMLVFRQSFGEMPAGFVMPSLQGLGQ